MKVVKYFLLGVFFIQQTYSMNKVSPRTFIDKNPVAALDIALLYARQNRDFVVKVQSSEFEKKVQRQEDPIKDKVKTQNNHKEISYTPSTENTDNVTENTDNVAVTLKSLKLTFTSKDDLFPKGINNKVADIKKNNN